MLPLVEGRELDGQFLCYWLRQLRMLIFDIHEEPRVRKRSGPVKENGLIGGIREQADKLFVVAVFDQQHGAATERQVNRSVGQIQLTPTFPRRGLQPRPASCPGKAAQSRHWLSADQWRLGHSAASRLRGQSTAPGLAVLRNRLALCSKAAAFKRLYQMPLVGL
jgi:hypothetical protein